MCILICYTKFMSNLISSLISFLIALIPTFSGITIQAVNQTTILFTGDIMLGRSVMGEAIDRNDYLYPFRNVQSFLSDADITFGNLENAVIKNCPRQYKGSFSFCTTSEIAKGLQESGVDVVTLANNHSYNFGVDGFEETKKNLGDIGIKSVGYNNLEIIEKNNIKFGFLGFDFVTSQINLNSNIDLVKTSDPQVDVLIVSPHWGEEYKDTANKFQQETAIKMIEAGADIIIGHHPHWVQNYEEINGKPVYYSLGNFIFDQAWSEETKKGLLVKITFEEKDIVKKEEIKTYTPKIGQPVLQEGV